ncbi:TPA: hypothetical protein N0F65_001615, partial [Lagenidium giganteum]
VDRSKKSFDEENKPFDKDSLTQRLIDWLYCPKESGKTKASASPAKKQKTGAKTAAKRTTKKKEQVEEEEDLDEDATESENDGDASGDDSSSDFDESKPKKKTAKASGRKSPARKKKNVVEDEEDDEQDEEQHDDENGDDGAKDKDAVEKPAAADYASKSELPADVRAKVSEIVAKGDAEELTLKKDTTAPASNPLADMFAQSSVIFKKKDKYVSEEPVAPKKKVMAEPEPPKTMGKKKRRKLVEAQKLDEQQEKEKAAAAAAGEDMEVDADAADVTDDSSDAKEDTTDKKQAKDAKDVKAKPGKKDVKAEKKDAKDTKKDATDDADDRTAPVQPTAESLEKSERTVFVGNVSLEATQKELKQLFTPCGKVEHIRFRNLPVAGCAVDKHGDQKLMMKVCANKKIFSETGDHCNAYVTFADKASIDGALKLNGTTFMEKKIRVDRETPVIDPRRSVFVGNLPTKVEDNQVWAFFNSRVETDDGQDAVENVRIIRDRATGAGKGFGYVLFKDVSLAAKALTLTGAKLLNRELRIMVCGKRCKNRKGEEAPAKKLFEGKRASAGAAARIALKRAAKGHLPQKLKVQRAEGEKKPKHAARKAKQLAESAAKPKSGKSGGKPTKDGKPGSKRGVKRGASSTPSQPKPKKPKHAARKARQAAEAAAAAAAQK